MKRPIVGFRLPAAGPALLLTLVYIGAAKFGLSLAFTTKQITTVWPPTGIAIGVLVLLGCRYWPSIFVGALVANLLTNEAAPTALGIAVGNTLEAVSAAYLLHRLIPYSRLDHLVDVLRLIGVVALVSTVIAASLGTLSLAASGIIAWPSYFRNWAIWWVGDTMGALMFAPLILVYARSFKTWRWSWRRLGEAAGLLALALGASWAVFWQSSQGDLLPATYLIFPFLILIAIRLRQPGVVVANVLVSMLAIWATTLGRGPFSTGRSLDQNLALLQLFVFTVATTGLILAAVLSERDQTEEVLRTQTQDLERTQASLLRQIARRKRLELQLKDANSRITDILAGILEQNDSMATGRRLRTPRNVKRL